MVNFLLLYAEHFCNIWRTLFRYNMDILYMVNTFNYTLDILDIYNEQYFIYSEYFLNTHRTFFNTN